MKGIGKTGSRQRGFTMIEMVLVLVVMALAGTVFLTRTTSGRNELIVQADILKSHLRHAQIKAMGDTVPWGIHVPDNGSYLLYRNNLQATSPLPGGSSQQHTFPAGIAISGVGSTCNYDSWGSPGPATLSFILSQGSETIDVTVTRYTGYIP